VKRFFRQTVWSREGVSARDWRHRNLYRIVLPYIDLMFIWFGVVGWANGIQTVQDAAGDSWQTGWSAMIAVCAVLALIGISFPHLWAFELAGKVPLIGLVCAYLAIFVARGIADPKVAATAGLFTALVAFPVWRVADISVHDLRPWAAKRRVRRGVR
jgi:hypothetical protein